MITIKIDGKIAFGIEPHIKTTGIAEILPLMPKNTKVAFLDLAPTAGIMELIHKLKGKWDLIVYYDHHLDSNKRQENQNILTIRKLFQATTIVDRNQAPCCCQIVPRRSLNQIGVIFFHADFDGLLSLMRGIGIPYPEMISDASIMDGGQRGKLSEKGSLLANSKNLGPYFTIDPAGNQKTLERVFQTFLDLARGKLEENAINAFRLEIFNAAQTARELAITLAQKAAFLEPNVVLSDFRKDIYSGKIISFQAWKEKIFELFGREILLCNIALGFLGEQVFIEIPRHWEIEGINLQEFLPEGIRSRLKNKIQIPVDRWDEFYEKWKNRNIS